VDFPLVLIELFSLGITVEALRAIGWKSAFLQGWGGSVSVKFSRGRDVSREPFFAR